MIIYQSTKAGFLDDILTNNIENIILKEFQDKLGHRTSENEIRSWKSSMMYMNSLLSDTEIPNTSGVAIEYQLPQSGKRIDFILTGKNEVGTEHAILIELKQWQEATLTNKDGVIISYVGKAEREVSHPSYQAWSYAALLKGFNETVYEENIELKPCAYLHNYEQENVVTNEFYSEYIEKAPIFLKRDAIKLREFIKQFVKHGDDKNIIYRIEKGKIRPSRALADSVVSMLRGNREFVLIDEQKVVYETALSIAKSVKEGEKKVYIVEGGPGTGKSVVAINLLVTLLDKGLNTRYVTKNAAPRAVYESKLTGTFRRSEISNLFTGSGSFTETQQDTFDALIIDEAHRLTQKSGMFKNLGENQIKEIIQSSKCSIFFIDEDQKVTFSDIGTKDQIIHWANIFNAPIEQAALASQFRCNGSDGYIAWVDNALQITETANVKLDSDEYDFRVIENPNNLRDLIFEKNKLENKARLTAGYCWNWVTKTNPTAADIIIPEYNFEMKWNLASDGNLWIIKPESVSEVGCIHTCQGLEVDYIGVIIGPDLIVRNGKIITNPKARARTDSSLKGYKKMLNENLEEATLLADRIIKNTYRTLMTRGMKGCFIYSQDTETRDYFSNLLK